VTLVDTNVLLDVLTTDPKWSEWSIIALRDRAARGSLFINEIVYAELAGHIATEKDLDDAVQSLRVQFQTIPKRALFYAGRTFRSYRSAGGVRTGVLPDFFIGAHAQVGRIPLLTRDVGRYRTYFPDVDLIAP
jgi:hypothetical protein